MGFLDRLRGKPDVKSLREGGDIEELVRALSYRDWTVRLEAAKALGELRDQRAVPALTAALEDRSLTKPAWRIPHMRGEVLRALGTIAVARAHEYPDIVISLLRILQDSRTQSGERSIVAAALEEIKDPRAVQPLSLVLETTPGAARALGAIGGPDSVKALKSALEYKRWDVHHAAAAALERIGETSTDPSVKADTSAALEKARKDRSEEYRKFEVLETLKSVKSYRLKILEVPGAPVRWPNFCCLCLGPVEVRETVSGGIHVERDRYRSVSVDGVPYCKFCHKESCGILSHARGVEISIDIWGSVTLIFENPEYGKMFAQANPGVAWPQTTNPSST